MKNPDDLVKILNDSKNSVIFTNTEGTATFLVIFWHPRIELEKITFLRLTGAENENFVIFRFCQKS